MLKISPPISCGNICNFKVIHGALPCASSSYAFQKTGKSEKAEEIQHKKQYFRSFCKRHAQPVLCSILCKYRSFFGLINSIPRHKPVT